MNSVEPASEAAQTEVTPYQLIGGKACRRSCARWWIRPSWRWRMRFAGR